MNHKIIQGLLLTLLLSPCLRAADAPVRLWEEQVRIPTYLIGPPDPNPSFYFGGQSQGAEHRIYPYPRYDNLTTEKVDKPYKMVYLENEYIKVGILPESGGKIFEAIDKTNGYNFFYRQHVIKPALISLLGAWISGGVEWDIPHHHRATSFLPLQYKNEENADGSKTVWVGELELRDRMRWAIGTTLRPGRSYLEVSFRIMNRTPLPVSMLCFSNVAVHVDDTYQIIFPPSTQWGTHHSKREMIAWPIANQRYGGGDFTGGVDVSWYKNHWSSNSVFAWNYTDDFLAGYDHGKRAGTMSIADHNVVPGKKFWTWGNGPNGRAQDTLLTDSDGPYIELMVGAYSDNQPDYTWLQPYETRRWTQYWYPFREIDGVKNANTEAAVNVDVKDGKVKYGFYTTSAHPQATVSLKLKDKVLSEEKVAIGPGKTYVKELTLPGGADQHDLRASIAVDGRELVAYSPIRLQPQPMPTPVVPPPAPAEIKTNEELYLAGLRIDQFRNPQLEPEPYWEEALKRDLGDVRVNTALAINHIKRARFADAERLLRKALERATDKHTMPKDGEPFYYLGLALKAQGKTDEAFDNFQKSTWSSAWRSPGYFEAAQIASIRGNRGEALQLAERSLEANALNLRALNLKAAMLRHLGRPREATELLAQASRIVDPLDMRTMVERWLLDRADGAAAEVLGSMMNQFPAAALEVAAEYLNAGLWQDGTDALLLPIIAAARPASRNPMMLYYLGHFFQKLDRGNDSRDFYASALEVSPDYVFPFQREMIGVLEEAMKANPSDSARPYYLGNLLYDWQPERAVALWEKSVALGADFPVVYRNLAVVYTRQDNAREKALAMLEKAAQLGGNAMVFNELDQLFEENGVAPEKRLAQLEKHQPVINRDDVIAREIALKIFAGKYDDAIALLKSRFFRAWEGGGRFSIGDYWTNALLLRGHQHLAAKRYKEALADYQMSMQFPANLQEAVGAGSARRPESAYWIGVAYEAMGDIEKAKQSWRESSGASVDAPATAPAVAGRGGRGGRGFGRGGAPVAAGARVTEAIPYYQALSLQKLGESARANAIFQQLVASGAASLSGANLITDAPTPPAQRNRVADAHYLAGLGHLGLNDKQKARQEFSSALNAAPDHLGAKNALTQTSN